MLALLVLVLLLALLLVLDQGGQVGVVGLDVVLPGLLASPFSSAWRFASSQSLTGLLACCS